MGPFSNIDPQAALLIICRPVALATLKAALFVHAVPHFFLEKLAGIRPSSTMAACLDEQSVLITAWYLSSDYRRRLVGFE